MKPGDMMPGDLLFVEFLADVFCYRLEQRPDNENEDDLCFFAKGPIILVRRPLGHRMWKVLTSQGFGFIAEHELQNKTKFESGL